MSLTSVRLAAALTASALAIAGCSGGTSTRDAAGAPKPVHTEQVAAQQALVAFVNALAGRHVDAALAMRCSAVQLPARDRARFSSTLDMELRRVGHIRRVETHVLPADSRHAEARPRANEVEVAYRVVTDAGPRAELHAQEVLERGEWRWCGSGTEASTRVCPASQAAIAALPGPDFPALPADPGPHFGPGNDRSLPGPITDSPGFVAARERQWAYRDGGGAAAAEYVFGSVDQALAAARARVAAVCAYVSQPFAIAGDAVGIAALQILDNAWVGLQVPGEEPMVDDVVFVVGRTEVELWISTTAPNSAHLTATTLANQVLRAAV